MVSTSHDFEQMPDEQPGDDLVNSAYSEIVDEFLKDEPAKSFQPWHLPRKHFCRLRQWCFYTQKLLQELKLSKPIRERPLRYLTLPGDELLDIRALSKVMENAGIKMQFLGFNTALENPRSAESDLSFSEVRQLEGIYEKPSEIIQHRIERITEENSTVRQKVLEHLPFDVLNLDFTGSMTGQPPRSAPSYFQVVRWLIDQQCNKRRDPWLLFLTTPFARNRTDSETAKQLWYSVCSNADNDEFAVSLAHTLQVSKGELLEEMSGSTPLDDLRYSKSLGLALSKWILGLVATRSDTWTVELIDSKSYRVYGNVPEMYSMCFKFKSYDAQSVDATGLTISSVSLTNPISELVAGLALIQSIGKTEDVDKRLDEDRDELNAAIDLSAALLSTVRYNPSVYKEWALNEMEKRGLLKLTEQKFR